MEGYEPSSLGASHSSLLVTTTWVGMGLVMASLVGFGTMIWAAGQSLVGTGSVDHSPSLFLIIGAIIGFGLLIVGFGLIFSGRKGYKEYVRRSGRTQ
ncbi:hypothetical protein FHE74_06525 [Corynebacterium tapiri]|uniref:Uncharacterized protein n=1 Tax=Corynebacterium tapiri TaxID=1448266 RepID=A0A5C4U4W8_9CORY|nr:hypothetical protein FHE74_06525 [Corynebacterium tapiri]